MADSKISALTGATTPLAGTEILPIVQSGITKKVSVANLTAGQTVSAALVSTTGTNLFTKTQSTTFGDETTYLSLGKGENGVGGMRLVGLGYNSTPGVGQYHPVYYGYVETSNTGGTAGDFVVWTRPSGSSGATAPTERLRIATTGSLSVFQATTALAPTYVKGAMYFDTTLNKLRIGGATGWETVTSV